MLTLIEGSLTSIAENELNEAVAASVASGKKTYLFVPEHETVTREAAMCALLPPDAPLSFEVTNFSRFVNTSFRAFGGITGKYCDGATSALIMWRTLEELAPFLYMTEKSSRISDGTVARALEMVHEMEALAIAPGELSEIKNEELKGNERLRRKLSDLTKIYSLYKSTLTKSYADMEADTERAAELLSENPEYLADSAIYIDGFTSFTEPQYKLIEGFIKTSSLTVFLSLPKAGADRYEYKEIKSTEKRLIQIADKLSAEKRIKKPDAENPLHAPIISAISRMLWTADGEIDNDYLQTLSEGDGRVRIFSAKNPYEECSFIADDIKRRVMEGGRYSDFVIVAGGTGRYEGIIDRVLKDADIPFYLSTARTAKGHEAIKLIHTAYRIIRRGFAREDVVTYMKAGLVGISRDESDECELYIEKWGIDGSRFTDPDGWNMNPLGYQAMTEEGYETLERLNEVREKLTLPLVAFRDDAKGAKTVREHALALFRFLDTIKLEEELRNRAVHLFSLGETSLAEENSRTFGIILEALDKLVALSGDMTADIESFEGQLSVLFSSLLVGTLPPHIDEVTVGSADMLRVKGKKHAYLIGVNEGVFPKNREYTSYFSDKDKSKLREMGLPIEPSADKESSRSLYSFTRAFTFGCASVTLSYPLTDASGAPILPSTAIDRIKKLTKSALKVTPVSSLTPRESLYSPKFSFKHIFREGVFGREQIRTALSKTEYAHLGKLSESSVSALQCELGPEALGIIYNGDLYLSQSKIEAFLDCPFSYFLKYNLRLDKSERADLSANIIGSFIHRILEDFFREINKKGIKVTDLTIEEKIALTEKSSRSFIKDELGEGYGEARTKIAISRLSRSALPVIEGLVDEFSDCDFEPAFFELSTDGKSEGSASPIVYEREDGKKIIIRGKIDRTDTYKQDGEVYVRVVDYKTGTKDFSPSDIAEGRNLQMFLYLKSIVETKSKKFLELIGSPEGNLVPAGVIYAKTSIKAPNVRGYDENNAFSAAKDASEREGMVLDEEIPLGAMNPAFTPLAYPETPNNAKGNAKRKYTREGWDELSETIKSVITDISQRMTSGKIPREPQTNGTRSACDRCSFKPVCRTPKT